MRSDESTPRMSPKVDALGCTPADPPAPNEPVTLDNWQFAPWNRWSYQHISEIICCARIGRGDGSAAELAADVHDVDGVAFETVGGERTTVGAFLAGTCTDGFLVLCHGRIVAERYLNGMAPHTRHLLQSVSKSLTGALAGVLVGRGLIVPERPVMDYLPELQGTSFAGATVRQVLDMSTGTKFSEEYDDPESDVRLYESAAGWRSQADPAGPDLFEYILTLHNHRPHGELFEYRSILTDLLGLIIERAGGRRFADLMSELLWAPLGAEHDAEITVDKHGNPMTDGGISVTLRDLGRFGEMYLRRGTWNGGQVVPAAWVDDTRMGDAVCRQAFARSESAARYPAGHYRNQWWVPDAEAGILLAAGIYGQFVYLDLSADVVVVKLSTLPVALDFDVSADHRRAFAAIAAELGRTSAGAGDGSR
jgi:CubicO group peptidase (beta-lactamase class C family)